MPPEQLFRDAVHKIRGKHALSPLFCHALPSPGRSRTQRCRPPRRTGRWQRRAPQAPASTSPVPPTLITESPDRLNLTRRPSVMISTGPLRRIVAPRSFADSFAARALPHASAASPGIGYLPPRSGQTHRHAGCPASPVLLSGAAERRASASKTTFLQ